jgi:ParB-like chromosome segregation protein Spo0J
VSDETDNSELLWLSPRQLVLWDDNPRFNEEAVSKVADSIERFGFAAPIVARAENREVCIGNTRLKAALKLGLEQVPVRLMDLSADEAHRLARADNRLGEIAHWNIGRLVEQLLADAEVDPGVLEIEGWTAEQLRELEAEATEAQAQAEKDLAGLPPVIEADPSEPTQNGESHRGHRYNHKRATVISLGEFFAPVRFDVADEAAKHLCELGNPTIIGEALCIAILKWDVGAVLGR